jgi:hypothetical protein
MNFVYHEQRLQKVQKVHVIVDEPLWDCRDLKDVQWIALLPMIASLVFIHLLDDSCDSH